MHEITVNLDTLLWIAGFITAIGAGLVVLSRWASPITRPYKNMMSDVKELKQRKLSCDMKFEHDQAQLNELKENDKMTMESLLLLLKHAETGNCTGEVAEGRKKLESYLINK